MAASGSRTPKKKGTLNDGERRRLRQLAVCLVLFALVFAGRGVDLEPVSRAVTTLGTWVEEDTDFRAVFAQVGEELTQGEAVETLRALWETARSNGAEIETDEGGSAPPGGGDGETS